jgi:hypothetical protein
LISKDVKEKNYLKIVFLSYKVFISMSLEKNLEIKLHLEKLFLHILAVIFTKSYAQFYFIFLQLELLIQ